VTVRDVATALAVAAGRVGVIGIVVGFLGAAPLAAHEGHGTAVTKPSARPSPAAAGGDAAEACPPATEIAQRLQARYDTTKNFRADFRQETKVAALGQGEEAFGTVVFMKPGRMHWEFQMPQRQSMIADGTTLWIYQPADKQVLKAAFGAAFISSMPVSFLAGVGRIKDDFNVEADPRGCNAQRFYLKLIPKQGQDLGGLTLAVTRPAYDIVEAAVTDPVGNVTTLSFSNIQRNAPIADDEFRFVVPPGVDIVNAPTGAAAR
jgi:outer membrane lipoprotein carrier protein